MLGASAHVTVVLSDPHSGTVSHMDKTNKQMDATAEIGRNPASKHQIQPKYGDEQAAAERDCRTHLTRLNSQARTGTGKKTFSVFS